MPERPRHRWSTLLWSAAALLPTLGAAAVAGAGPQAASPTPPAVDAAFFTREVQPLLQQKCLGCHGVGTIMSRLDLRTREAALKGGAKGPALVPGNAEGSLLYKLISGQRAPTMPPQGKLAAAEVAKLKRWIDGGAPWAGAPIQQAKEQVWWSFKTPVLPPVPKVRNAAWVKNPIDAFILAKLEASGLKPSPPAPRRVLIRRAYLDLIGLPPTPEEVRAFETDASPDAWEKVVDRLLASPHYGERWGRHWMDLVRYADSCGYEGDKDRPLAWRYRDYILHAFNEDKPYNTFVQEQLAGDELRPNDPEALIATAYLGCGLEDFAMVKLPQTRADELDDLVSTTGSTILGLTIGCARCHDHKYDPVKQTDYYRLQALFAPTERREVDIPTPEERREIDAKNAAVEQELAPLRERMSALWMKGAQAATTAGQAKPNEEQIKAALPEPERKQLADLQAQIKMVEAKRIPFPKAMIVTDKAREFPPVHLLVRGDANHPGPVVQPGFIVSLPGGSAEVTAAAATPNTTGRRKALAEWLTSPQNPLTARVWMNRVWRQHFGRGIVATPSNFGLNGELPTHQELLDWLAVRFVSGGWKLKPMHRLMLLSATYRQASQIRPDAAKADPQNRLLWRMPVRRLEAEAIRDSILAVAGTLNPEMGGPPVYPPVDPALRSDTYQGYNWPEGEDSPKTWRRSVYIKVKRSLLFPELEVFDCPEITAAVAARNITTTPNQALTMLNDPLILRQAGLFAQRLEKESGKDPKRQIDRAYHLAFARAPSPREVALGLKFLEEPPATPGSTRLAEYCHTLLNLSEFVYVP
ncbi:MAG TPA: PSD1 and planctomycete cytochrome C domain-containing protein [Armatimonadota bacterium]|nr:PSD1 and planctomycete cytochrome C domain-containing protein [Armatimonadota bacterium]